MRKKIFSLVLVLCLCLGLLGNLSVIVSAASNGSCGNNATWVLDDNGTLTISGTGAIKIGDEESPGSWHQYRANIKKVVINDGLTSIEEDVFRYCNNLISVQLPNSMTSIGKWSFAYCYNLIDINIPENVTYIGVCAFHSCSNLKNITIPNGIKVIEEGTFYGCKSISSLVIPDGVTMIGHASLSCCDALASIDIPYGVTKIEESAFRYSSNLKDVYYGGTREQWNEISIKAYNDDLRKANIHYKSSDNTSGIPASNNQKDYISLFGELINGRKDYNTNLEDLLMKEYSTCDVAFLKDCYLVDMNNDSIPELLCVFCDEWGPDEYAVLIEYDNGFKVGAEIPFNYNSGSAGSEYYRVLKANGNFYLEKYNSVRQNYDDPNGWVSKDEIILNKNGEEKVVYSATSNYGINMVNGQQVDEIDYEYVHNNFEIVVEGRNYGESWSGYEPQFGKDYDKFWDANTGVTVTLNGKKIIFDQQPIIVDGRTLVPLRAIFEELGATVDWDGNTQTVTSTKGEVTISMTIGKAEMYKNGKLITLDVVPQIVNGRTLVPVRAIAESFNIKVDWDGATSTVLLYEN